MPYLEGLEKIPNKIDKKVTINKDLKRFEQAVRELANVVFVVIVIIKRVMNRDILRKLYN